MIFNPLVWIWVAVAVTVLALAVYRNLAGIHANASFHILDAEVKQEVMTLGTRSVQKRGGSR
jgi:uncharacterized protein (DUF2236 family)